MSKIICDVCGTSYQESAMQCPICGCVRPVDATVEVEPSETKNVRRENYTYVKGGRFSKANVQKRNQGILLEDTTVPTVSKQKDNKNDKGLVIAVCALLIAIIAVVIYIVIHFLAPANDAVDTQPDVQNTTVEATVQTTETPTVLNVPCTEIVLSDTDVRLTTKGAIHTLNVTLAPQDTTDELSFVSSNEAVATVSENGEVVAVATGETVITVSCGEVSVQCRIVCSINEEVPTTPSTEPTDGDVEFKAPFKINKTDVSISVGETFQLKLTDANGEIIPVTWSPTIADVCTIDGNSVTGAAKGKIELSATYNGETYTCIVRVR